MKAGQKRWRSGGGPSHPDMQPPQNHCTAGRGHTQFRQSAGCARWAGSARLGGLRPMDGLRSMGGLRSIPTASVRGRVLDSHSVNEDPGTPFPQLH
eukprot:gene18759-biopygen903